jgi:hypothetical protein
VVGEPCGCVTIDTLLKRVSRLLSDDYTDDKDTVRWPRATVLDFLNEGLAHIQSLRPDAFTTTKVFELKPGKNQEAPKGVASIISVDCVVEHNADGTWREVNPVVEQDQSYAKYFAGNACAPGAVGKDCAKRSDVKVVAYSKTGQSNPRAFNVSPSVPSGKSIHVNATVVMEAPCYCIENPDECIDLPTRFHAALVDWILHRAYSQDIESAFATNASVRFESSFYRFISNGYLQEARHASGYYNGQDPNKGMPDPNTTQRAVGVR